MPSQFLTLAQRSCRAHLPPPPPPPGEFTLTLYLLPIPPTTPSFFLLLEHWVLPCSEPLGFLSSPWNIPLQILTPLASTSQVSAPGYPQVASLKSSRLSLSHPSLLFSSCCSSQSTAHWAGKSQEPAEWKRHRKPVKWFSIGMAWAGVSGKLWKRCPGSPATLQLTLPCGAGEMGRERDMGGSFSPHLLLGLVL